MRPLSLNRLHPAALCALAALVGGLLAGATTVHGLHDNRYGPSNSSALIQPSGLVAPEDGSFGGYRSDGDSPDVASEGCQQCSERDLGYRWAVLAAVRQPDQCPSDSWGFRRGCLDFVGGI